MKKHFTVTYEIMGCNDGSKTDKVLVWAKTISEAIKEFTSLQFDIQGIKFNYTEYSIVNIEA